MLSFLNFWLQVATLDCEEVSPAALFGSLDGVPSSGAPAVAVNNETVLAGATVFNVDAWTGVAGAGDGVEEVMDLEVGWAAVAAAARDGIFLIDSKIVFAGTACCWSDCLLNLSIAIEENCLRFILNFNE